MSRYQLICWLSIVVVGHAASHSKSQEIVVSGLNQNDLGGSAQFAGGDFNGDGISDLVVASPNFDIPGSINVGRVHILFGGPDFRANIDLGRLDSAENANAELGFTLTGAQSNTTIFSDSPQIGQTLSKADINNDGVDDLLVGAPLAGVAGSPGQEGVVFILFGRSSGFRQHYTTEELMVSGNADGLAVQGFFSGARFGSAMAEVDDFNGDGLHDLLITSSAPPNAGSSSTRSFNGLIFGRPPEAAWPAIISLNDLRESIDGGNSGILLQGRLPGDEGGSAAVAPADYDGDGLTDILYAAPRGEGGRGEVVLIGGREEYRGNIGVSDPVDAGLLTTFAGDGDDAEIGRRMTDVGDFNGDGKPDFALSAPETLDQAGRIYVVFGRSPGNLWAGRRTMSTLVDNNAALRIDGAQGDALGDSLAAAGDFNGDGFDDILAGTRAERAYLIFGGERTGSVPVDAVSDRFDAPSANTQFARSVGASGDLDADGSGDLLIGAPFANIEAQRSGATYLRFGEGEDRAPRLHGTLSHAWYDREAPGQGVLVEFGTLSGEPAAFATWYTFDEGQPLWLATSLAAFDESTRTVETDLVVTSGGRFGADFDTQDVEIVSWGRVQMTLTQCDRLLWEYERASDGQTGRLVLTPVLPDLLQTDTCTLSDQAVAGLVDRAGIGSYWNPERGGEGFVIDYQDSNIFASWFTYDASGAQAWLVGSGLFDPVAGSSRIEMFTANGAQFGSAFDALDVLLTPWGLVELELRCGSATLHYDGQFDAGNRQVGTIELTRFSEGLNGLSCN